VNSRFWRLFGASAVSNLADGIGRAAIPLLAATLPRCSSATGRSSRTPLSTPILPPPDRRSGHLRRMPMRRWSRMKANSSPPITILVHQELRRPSNVINVWITPSTRTPSTVPNT
jgi:hypothetical protein